MSSSCIASQLKTLELERRLEEMELKAGRTGKISSCVAIQLRNQGLSERKLPEMECKGCSPCVSSAPVEILLKIQLENQVQEGKVTELEKDKAGSSRFMSPAPGEIPSQKSKDLELKVAELERKLAGHPEKLQKVTLSTARQERVKARVTKLKKLITASQELDLAFLVDATGSMTKPIEEVKKNAHDIALGIKKAWPQLKLRVAFVPYRDYEDKDRDVEELCDFTDDFVGEDSTFGRALKGVEAGGLNSDWAEDVFSGLENVGTYLSWKSRTRVLVHIGDAPCHGKKFYDHDNTKVIKRSLDRCPDGDEEGRSIKELLERLRDNCQVIRYLFCHINDSTLKMLRVFKEECGDRGNWIQEENLEEKLTDGNRDGSKMVDVVVTVSGTSISQSMQMGDSNLLVSSFEDCPVEMINPPWETILCEQATQIKYKLPDSLEDLFYALATDGKLEMEDMPDSIIQIAEHPFSWAESVTWPYVARVYQPRSAPIEMVLRRFKTPLGQDDDKVNAKEAYFEQMELQAVAAKMAEEFNTEIQRFDIEDYKTVQFTLVSTLRVRTQFFNMEEAPVGGWTKYSENSLDSVNYAKEHTATFHAFSHWTYHRSKGLLVVDDLQGVARMGFEGAREVWLRDPSVHCKDAVRYETTKKNWGEPGMKRFLETHQCNSICHTLGLPPTTNGSRYLSYVD